MAASVDDPSNLLRRVFPLDLNTVFAWRQLDRGMFLVQERSGCVQNLHIQPGVDGEHMHLGFQSKPVSVPGDFAFSQNVLPIFSSSRGKTGDRYNKNIALAIYSGSAHG